MRLTGTLLALCLAATGCGPISYDYSKEPDPRNHEFVIGASDGLKITVWKNPELSTDAKVRPDGTITMPLIGDVHAAGRTPGELKLEIGKKLSNFVKSDEATVTIAVTEVNSYRFTVSGNVEHGGIFTSKYYVTVAEAIALAGGLNKFADPKKLVIVRLDEHGRRRVPIDYNRISSGEHPDENLVLISGDNLFAP
ncbi:MAG TPA: polysaccharide biosynthesis/export family protein [Polyangia bacterium]|nr:polysaccharide biosynthesis/export family protein [Polyangia bacterium]